MRRSTDHLTDRRIRSLKPEERQYEVTDGAVPGLALRVFPAGSKSWFLRYGPREARQRIVLGPYPSLSLEAARNKARELVAGVKIVGRDPMAEKKAQRTARREGPMLAPGAWQQINALSGNCAGNWSTRILTASRLKIRTRF